MGPLGDFLDCFFLFKLPVFFSKIGWACLRWKGDDLFVGNVFPVKKKNRRCSCNSRYHSFIENSFSF